MTSRAGSRPRWVAVTGWSRDNARRGWPAGRRSHRGISRVATQPRKQRATNS